jgi:hypothetical protein
MSQAIGFKDPDNPMAGVEVKGDRPIMGCLMRVGSVTARTMQEQDYWTTTPVVEIVLDTPGKVIFTTRSGSTYEWRP